MENKKSNKNKKIIFSILGLGVLASSCIFYALNLNSIEKKDNLKEKIDISLFEENDKKRSQYKGYTVEEVYINGEKVKIDVQNHGEHFHIIYKNKKYSLEKEEYESLFNKDNKIVLKESIEKKLSEIDKNEIISYEKHGDHWHIKTKNGEFITYEDPSNLKSIKDIKENSIKTISKKEIQNLKIKSFKKHGNHWHILTESGEEYISYENPEGKKTIDKIKEKEIAKVVENSTLFEKVISHEDHFHVIYKGKEYVIDKEIYEKALKENKFDPTKIPNNKFDDEDEKNKKDLTKQELEEKAKKIVDKIIKTYKFTEDEIKKIKIDIENNVIIYPHGNHYHYEAIDKNKPYNINGKKLPADEVIKNPQIENLKIVGPFPIEIIKNNFDKEKFIKENNIEGIINQDNFNIVAFKSSRDDVKLLVDEKVSKNWAYLVLDGLDEKIILEKIKEPKMDIPDELYFKSWTGYLPEVKGRDIILTANFGEKIYKDSPIVIGPSKTRISVPNLYDYRALHFTTNIGGYLELNGILGNNFHYLMKENTKLKELLNSGLVIPKPIAKEGFEFIKWNIAGLDETSFDEIDENKNSSDLGYTVAVAIFGRNSENLGDYIPEDENNPLKENDRNMPNPRDIYMPYDETKYVKVAFSSGEHGKIVNFFGDNSKSVVFLVRKGLTLNEAFVVAPSVIEEKGYKQNNWNIDMNKPITEDILFTIDYIKSAEISDEEIPNNENEKILENKVPNETEKNLKTNKDTTNTNEIEKTFENKISNETKEIPKLDKIEKTSDENIEINLNENENKNLTTKETEITNKIEN